MSVCSIVVTINTRAALWVAHLAREEKTTSAKYIEGVMLRHLNSKLGVDLRQSPHTGKGANDGTT